MLPGLDGTGELLEQFSSYLPSSLVPILAKYPSDASLGYDELQTVVEELIPQNEPYVILGESFSGPIAIRLASQQSKYLKGLVLVNTFLSCPRPIIAHALPIIPNFVLDNPPNRLIDYVVRNCSPESTGREGVKAIVRKLEVLVVRSRLDSIRDINVSREAELVKVPVCVLRSISDTFVSSVVAQSLIAALVGSEQIKMPGDHFVLQAFPKQSASEVARFCFDVLHISEDEA